MYSGGAEELLKERRERVEKTLRGLRPDRVPFIPSFHYFPARYTGLTYSEYSSDYHKFSEAVLKVYQDFEFDASGLALPGAGMTLPLNFILTRSHPDLATRIFAIARPFHEILRDKYTRWPGVELSPNMPAQFIGGKFMEADEYGELAKDPIGFIARKIVPRVYEALRDPVSPEAYGTLIRFGMEAKRFEDILTELMLKIRGLGYPAYPSGFGYAPLDFIADHMRHITYTLTDLYRHPDRVREAIEALTPIVIEWSRLTVRLPPEVLGLFDIKIPLAFIPLHLNEMVPPKLFRELYWEPLKKVVVGLIDAGAMTWIFFEGNYEPFLETILELPKGRVIAFFERTNLRKARKVLGDHAVIMGGVPPALLILGAPGEVFNEVCRLLNDVKEPGGFIFAGSGVAGVPDETRPENLRAAIEAVRKCGKYE